MDPHLVAFVGVAALVTLSPGPDMALMFRNVLRGGARVVPPTALGTCLGLLAWGAASSLGIAAVVAASAGLYAGLRLAGAAYLIFLGLVALRGALRGADGPGSVGATDRASGMPRPTAFRQALLTNLLNPKIGVFYATLLPQFIPPGSPPLATSMLMAAIHAGLNIVWLTVYGRTLARFGDVLARSRVRRALEGLSGTVLVALGIGVAIERA